MLKKKFFPWGALAVVLVLGVAVFMVASVRRSNQWADVAEFLRLAPNREYIASAYPDPENMKGIVLRLKPNVLNPDYTQWLPPWYGIMYKRWSGDHYYMHMKIYWSDGSEYIHVSTGTPDNPSQISWIY